MRRVFTFEQGSEVVDLYHKGLSGPKIAHLFGVSETAVDNQLRRSGVKRRGQSECQRIYELNESVFDSITQESAYWVGMMITDGTIAITHKQKILSLTCKRSDEETIINFRNFLQSSHPVEHIVATDKEGNKHPASRITVSSTRLVEALHPYGVVPNKTGKEEIFHLEGNRDFWRGAIDGDGWIVQYGKAAPRLGLTGSKVLSAQFSAFCTHHGVLYPSITPNNSVFKCMVYGNRAMDMMSILYNGATTALGRKSRRAAEIIAAFGDKRYRRLARRQRSLVTNSEIDEYLKRI